MLVNIVESFVSWNVAICILKMQYLNYSTSFIICTCFPIWRCCFARWRVNNVSIIRFQKNETLGKAFIPHALHVNVIIFTLYFLNRDCNELLKIEGKGLNRRFIIIIIDFDYYATLTDISAVTEVVVWH